MDKKVLNDAVENVSIIKAILDRTSKSFAAFSKIFIYWGILFIPVSILNFLMLSNKEQVNELFIQYPILPFIFPLGIVAVVAALIYRSISKKIPLVGLEKHLMKVWILILIMGVIPTRVDISTESLAIDMSAITVDANSFSTQLFSLAIALITTSLFTSYKQLRNMGYIYIGISIGHAYFYLPIYDSFQILGMLLMPFTFLYTGFFLKSQQERGA